MTADLEDLRIELWIRLRNSGEITWTTKEGKTIPIKDMSTPHLINTINPLERTQEMQEIACDYEAFMFKHEDAGDRV